MDPLSSEHTKALEAIHYQAYTFYRKGHYPQARDFFQLLTLMNPGNVNYWMGLGACLQMMQSFEKALEAYTTAAVLEDTEQDPLPHLHAAECLFALKEMERGFMALDSAEQIAKPQEKYRTFLGQLALIRQQWSNKS